ncbi:hypothetical protein, partial [uncultured Microbacterium sp.]|uniref:hypothetical protein n=1 Tax=uncultured Microbacterium sp. TaxID=191216 RepID=UPI00338FE079
ACAVDWCTSREVINIAREIRKNGLQKLGYEWINLDDCWGLRNESTGKIYPDPDRFPRSGGTFFPSLRSEAVVDFRAGTYSCQ